MIGQRSWKCVSEKSLAPANLPTLGHHYKLSSRRTLNTGSGQLPTLEHHYKLSSQKTLNSCMSHAPMYLWDYPKVTLLGGPLSHTHLHRGNRVPELQGGSGQLLTRERHDKLFNATDVDPGDINAKLNDSDEVEAVHDELTVAMHSME